jgi:hypothetical protein
MYDDILLENFYESYNNLTIKTMMMIKFVARTEVNSEFIFKVSLIFVLTYCKQDSFQSFHCVI